MIGIALPTSNVGQRSFQRQNRLRSHLKDASIPVEGQQMMIAGTGVEWIVKDIESGHSPQGSQPEKLTSIVVGLAKAFQGL